MSLPDSHALKETIGGFDTVKVLEIAGSPPGEYRPEAVEIAQQELMARGVPVPDPAEPVDPPASSGGWSGLEKPALRFIGAGIGVFLSQHILVPMFGRNGTSLIWMVVAVGCLLHVKYGRAVRILVQALREPASQQTVPSVPTPYEPSPQGGAEKHAGPVRYCPACGVENPAARYHCHDCGRSLSGTIPRSR